VSVWEKGMTVAATRKLSVGKQAALRAVSTPQGIIAALALDQRGSLAALMGRAAGRQPSSADIEAFKATVSARLSPLASAVLLDLEYGQAALERRASNAGLILAYEKDTYGDRTPERMPELLGGLCARRLKEAGAAGVKVLLHYAPSSPAALNASKRAWVESVGAECEAEDLLFFLEVLGYHPLVASEGPVYARRRPEIVASNIAEFARECYRVDVLKVEFPVDLKVVAGTQSCRGKPLYSRAEAAAAFRQAAGAARQPFIYLSAGVSHEEFLESLGLAAEAGVPYSGVLCGRATWQGGVAVYAERGLAALERWLETEGRRRMEALNLTLRRATPWQEAFAPSSQEG
jgi:tagatose 1,6-diphosphate aldolase